MESNTGYIFAIFISIFLLMIALIVIVSILNYRKRKKYRKFGKKQMAKFVQIVKGKTEHREISEGVYETIQYYCVIYQFKNSKGEITQAETSQFLTDYEANKFKRAEYFEIYVLNDKPMVLDYPTEQQIEKYSKLKDFKYCSYCGSQTSVDTKKCPNCGANQFNDIL